MGLSTHTQESFKALKERREATALRLVTSCQDASSMIQHFTEEELMRLALMLRQCLGAIAVEIDERK